MIYTRNCLHCTQEFKTNRNIKVFCSKSCKIKTANKRKNNIYIPKPKAVFLLKCNVCAIDFQTNTADKLYCSKKCRGTAAQKKRQELYCKYKKLLAENPQYTYQQYKPAKALIESTVSATAPWLVDAQKRAKEIVAAYEHRKHAEKWVESRRKHWFNRYQKKKKP